MLTSQHGLLVKKAAFLLGSTAFHFTAYYLALSSGKQSYLEVCSTLYFSRYQTVQRHVNINLEVTLKLWKLAGDLNKNSHLIYIVVRLVV